MKIQKKDPIDRLKRRNSKGRKWIIRIIAAVILILCANELANWIIEDEGSWKPEYQKVELAGIVLKDELTQENYHTILTQTGLGREAADMLMQTKKEDERIQGFEKYQANFFSSGNYECRKYAVIVHEERIRDENGDLVKGFEILDVRNGDIFITKATHSLGWRHGHAAIVTNAFKGETLEAISIGETAITQHVDKWQTYPSFIQLRLKNYDSAEVEEIAKYANRELFGLPYGLLTGIMEKAPDEIKRTQCSHLVWYPYERFGYDLDSDGSWLVTPNDIINSEYLEIIQLYGVNPEEIWN